MICLFPGLKKSPKVLQDTMGTYINPESLAASEVQVNGLGIHWSVNVS